MHIIYSKKFNLANNEDYSEMYIHGKPQKSSLNEGDVT